MAKLGGDSVIGGPNNIIPTKRLHWSLMGQLFVVSNSIFKVVQKKIEQQKTSQSEATSLGLSLGLKLFINRDLIGWLS